MAARRTHRATVAKDASPSTTTERTEEVTGDDVWDLKAPIPPRSDAQQREAFRLVRIPADVYETLWQWRATREQRESVLEFLLSIAFQHGHRRALRRREQRVLGQAHQSERSSQSEQKGLLKRANDAVDRLISTIEEALVIFDDMGVNTEGVERFVKETILYDPRIVEAQPHLQAALQNLKDPVLKRLVRFDHRIRRARTVGHPHTLVLALHKGQRPRPVSRSEVEQHVQALLQPFAPAVRGAAARLSRRLVVAVVPRSRESAQRRLGLRKR